MGRHHRKVKHSCSRRRGGMKMSSKDKYKQFLKYLNWTRQREEAEEASGDSSSNSDWQPNYSKKGSKKVALKRGQASAGSSAWPDARRRRNDTDSDSTETTHSDSASETDGQYRQRGSSSRLAERQGAAGGIASNQRKGVYPIARVTVSQGSANNNAVAGPSQQIPRQEPAQPQPAVAASCYDYNGPLIVLSKTDLQGERPKDFCLFCGIKSENIRAHMIELHFGEQSVQKALLMEQRRQKSKAWKFLTNQGNERHASAEALSAGMGYIIPCRLRNRRRHPYEMRRCESCAGWYSANYILTHFTCCPAKEWHAFVPAAPAAN